MTAISERLTTALADRYRVERELGAGGMATVYLAHDVRHDRKVAIKVLKPELAAVLGAERFVVEIKTTASLQHPHILPLFDSGTADGFLFYVMPYIQGETIREKLNRETQFGVDEAVRIAREVADALDYAHRNGVIHRDIKPENILLHDGRAMVMDFGIALAVSAAAGGRMTETGLSLGTPHYMSPEQATAEKDISARSDVYSLGSVLYEMLTGQPPHLGGSAQQIIMKIITEPADSVTKHRRSVPANVVAAVSRSLEKLPADRFETAAKFGDALGNPHYMDATRAVGAMAGARGGSALRYKRIAIAASVVAGLAVAVAVLGWLEPEPAPIVSRNRIVLWENPVSMMRVGRLVGISPDGATVVYVDSTAAGTQLFSKERDRIDASALAGSTGVRGSPTFSPDGAWIAFVSDDGKLKKIPRIGGSAITLADSLSFTRGGNVVWLDGGKILYTDRAFGVRTVSAEGGASRVVLPPDPGQLTVNASGLPGGHAVLLGVCIVIGCGTSELRVLDLRTNPATVTVLMEHVIKAWWLPGGEVAFVRRDGGVFAAPFDVRTLTFARPPAPVLEGVRISGGAVDLAMSANGTVIYVPGGRTRPGLSEPVWVSRTGTATLVDTAWTFPFSIAIWNGLAISPDGKRLAVSVRRDEVDISDIWIKQLDHGPLTRLTFEDHNFSPAWTADGRDLVYGAHNKATGEYTLRRRRADGTGVFETLLATKTTIGMVAPTRDSAAYVLGIVEQQYGFALWHRGDTAVTPLLGETAFNSGTPALSPDGRWLAYGSSETGRRELYVRPFPNIGDGKWQVSRAGGTEPRWAHSGRELFYVDGAGALVAAAVLPGASFVLGAQTALFDTGPFMKAIPSVFYDVAPDDKRFLFLRPVREPVEQGPDKLVQIVNWGAEVHAKLAGRKP